MSETEANTELVAYCGLYCGACYRYKKGSCAGCHKNEKASWCKVRTCCVENSLTSCADCSSFKDPQDCAGYNNIIAKIFGFIFRSDRAACIRQIRELGLARHAAKMAAAGVVTIKR